MSERSTIHGYLGAAYLAFLWGFFAYLLWVDTGLFYWLGIDFSMFYAAARTFVADGPASVYDLDRLADQLGPLHAHYGPYADELKVRPVPYPPLFSLLLLPFSVLPPIVAYVFWMLVNAGLAAWVARDIARCAGFRTSVAIPLALLSFPLANGLLVGQPVGFLLLFFYLAYRALKRGDDFRAGIWIGLLLLKPQLAIGLLVVLFFKRRWHALAGAIAMRGAVALTSVAILGADGMIAYLRTVFGYASGFEEIASPTVTEQMISWRGLVSIIGGELTESQGLAVTLILSIITLMALPLVWRGDWSPQSGRFALQMLATGIVTILVGYDMHLHGAIVLVVPAMILVLSGEGPRIVPVATRICLFVLPLFMARLTLMALGVTALLIVALVVIVIGELFQQRESVIRVPVRAGET